MADLPSQNTDIEIGRFLLLASNVDALAALSPNSID